MFTIEEQVTLYVSLKAYVELLAATAKIGGVKEIEEFLEKVGVAARLGDKLARLSQMQEFEVYGLDEKFLQVIPNGNKDEAISIEWCDPTLRVLLPKGDK